MSVCVCEREINCTTKNSFIHVIMQHRILSLQTWGQVHWYLYLSTISTHIHERVLVIVLRLFLRIKSHEIMLLVSYGIRIMLGVLTLLGLYQNVFVFTQAWNYCILWQSHEIMLHLYSLIWYKNYVRSTDIVGIISECFCFYSSMKLLYSVAKSWNNVTFI